MLLVPIGYPGAVVSRYPRARRESATGRTGIWESLGGRDSGFIKSQVQVQVAGVRN